MKQIIFLAAITFIGPAQAHSSDGVISYVCTKDATHSVVMQIAAEKYLEFAVLDQSRAVNILGSGKLSSDSVPTHIRWYYDSLVDENGKPFGASQPLSFFRVTFSDKNHSVVTSVDSVNHQSVILNTYSKCVVD